MRKINILGLAALSLIFILSGCAIRSYRETRDRIDQDLYSGNRGYLKGEAPAEEQGVSRKTTRDIRVIEVELAAPFKGKKGKTAAESSVPAASSEPSEEIPRNLK